MAFSFVEPCWAPIRLPAMLWVPRIGLPFLTRNWAPVTKKTRLKSRASRRARVIVMVPEIRSTAPLVRSGMRVAGVDSFSSNLIGLPSFFSTLASTSLARSTEKPPQLFCLSMKPNGGDAVRVPTTIVPVRAIFSRVVSARAGAAPANSTPSASHATRIRFVVAPMRLAPLFCPLSVGEDLRQEVPGPLVLRPLEEDVRRPLLHDLPHVHKD